MALCAEGDLPRPALNRYWFSRVAPQSDCGDEPLRRLRRRPRVFGLAGFKPALTENHRPLEFDGWWSGARCRPLPRLRGLDEHDAFGCLSQRRSFDGLRARFGFGEA